MFDGKCRPHLSSCQCRKCLESPGNLSSHSFRRGLSMSVAREGVNFELIKKQGGWKSDATVWDYIEEGQQLSNNATHVLMEKLQSRILNYD